MTTPKPLDQLTPKAGIIANTKLLLNRDCNIGRDHEITRELSQLYAKVGGISSDENINDWDNVELESGVAINPIQAAKCLEETLRTQMFIKGIYQCLLDKLSQKHTVNVVYAGTGPYGCLLLPLLALMPTAPIRVSLIDIHKDNTESIQRIVEHLGIDHQITSIECADATTWSPKSPVQFDIVISETMTALLGREPQVAIFAHLQQFLADDGILIPEKVSLSAVLLPFESANLPDIPLGQFFELNRELTRSLAKGHQDGLIGEIVLPRSFSSIDYQHLSFRTDIQIYRAHWLTFGQCSLNLSIDYAGLKLEPGGSIKFCYRMTALPKFEFTFPVESMSSVLPEKTELGAIAVQGIKRFWHRARLIRDGRHGEAFVEREILTDIALLENFDVSYHQALSYVCDYQPSFDEFETWLLRAKESNPSFLTSSLN